MATSAKAYKEGGRQGQRVLTGPPSLWPDGSSPSAPAVPDSLHLPIARAGGKRLMWMWQGEPVGCSFLLCLSFFLSRGGYSKSSLLAQCGDGAEC